MSAESAAAVRSFSVGRYTCTLTVPRFKPGEVMHAVFEWAPSQPTRFSTAEWAQYRAARNHAVAGIAAELGINAMLVEL